MSSLPASSNTAPTAPTEPPLPPPSHAPRSALLNCAAFLGLIGATLLFGIALFALVHAPTTFLWFLAIGATEFGHWFGVGSLILVGTTLLLRKLGRNRQGPWQLSNRLTLILSLIATGLFFSPLARAWTSARRIGPELATAFPHPAATDSATKRPITLNFAELWNAPPTAVVPIETLQFSEHANEPLHLRFYRSQKPRPAPCILVIHTGGWNNGTPDEFSEFNSRLAQSGYAIAAIEYRLAPRWKWPAQRQDVIDAMNYLRKNATRLGIDPHRFVLLGRSAGGQIAESVAYSLHDPSVRGVIAFYAPADMHFAYRYARSDDILDSLKLLRDYLAGGPMEQPANYDSASGYGLVNKDSPPTLLLHGKRDELVWVLQSQRLDAQLEKAGVPHYFLKLDWATHAFDYNPSGPGGQISTQTVEWFLESVVPLS